MSKKLNKKGFTLIEVVLVLAIGGLIFLLAFLAYQQVSRNRRDTQRRSDTARVVAELENYKADGRTTYPANSVAGESCSTTTSGSFGLFLSKYLCKNGSFTGPQGDNYSVIASGTPGSALAKDKIRYKLGTVNCSNQTVATNNTVVVVEIGLDNDVPTCKDNQ